jgi:hypothetical protein
VPDTKIKLLCGWLIMLAILVVVRPEGYIAAVKRHQGKMSNPTRSNQSKPEKRNSKYQCVRLISTKKAAAIAENLCRTANNGVQAVYNGKFDVDVNKVRYFYFDMAYVLSRDQELRTKDISILSLFVDSVEKKVYQAIECRAKGELFYVPGKLLKR